MKLWCQFNAVEDDALQKDILTECYIYTEHIFKSLIYNNQLAVVIIAHDSLNTGRSVILYSLYILVRSNKRLLELHIRKHA